MKIVYDHNVFAWQRYGGISRYFCELALRLSKSSQRRVRIVAPLYSNRYLAGARRQLGVCGVYVPDISIGSRAVRIANRALVQTALSLMRPDLIHETYYSASAYRLTGARTIVTVFDMIHELFPDLYAPDDRTSDAKRQAVERADHVICISEQTRTDLLARWPIAGEKVSVIHLGTSLVEQGGAELPARLRGTEYLLYVGPRGHYKNFARLLQAFASSRELRERFTLLAFGGGEFSSEELALHRKLGLDAQSVLHESGDDDMLQALYRHAVLLVYPSLYEGFGIPPLEAMSLDCPVVCSAAGSLAEVVGDAAVTFDPTSVESIRAAIERTAGDAQTRAALIQKGRERQRLFSWDTCAAQTLAVYEKVLRR
jgi:glycosyltransferase involved in cell wall biosynthesis